MLWLTRRICLEVSFSSFLLTLINEIAFSLNDSLIIIYFTIFLNYNELSYAREIVICPHKRKENLTGGQNR